MNELRNHVITSIEEYHIRTRYPRFHGKNSKLPAHSYGYNAVGILEITTDKGATGFGLGRKDRLLVASLLGKNLADVFDPEIGILSPEYYQADIALHDLVGKILGISVKKMISKDAVEKVECYDGAVYMNDISPDRAPQGVDGLMANCHYDKDVLGYKDFKIKIGRGKLWMGYEEGLQRDIEITRRIREEFPDAKIMVDANDAYDLETAIKFMEAVKDCDIYWFEEPFHENETDLKAFKEYLAKNSPQTLIADGEWAPDYIHTAETLALVEDLAEKKLMDVVLMDTADYGFTNWRKYLKELSGRGFLASPHNWGMMLKTMYCSHLAAAYPELIPTIEGVGDTAEGICWDKYTLENGLLTVPDAPGFGMDFIWGRKA